MKNIAILFLFAVVSIVLIVGGTSFAAMSDANIVKEATESSVQCTVCHAPGNFKELNLYGADYNEAGRNAEAVAAIADKDSDEDGVSNAEEITAGTNPGAAE